MSGSKKWWTQERIDDLRRRWAAGEPASAIAVAMGQTRNSIIGKLKRLGLLGLMTAEKNRRISEGRRNYFLKPGALEAHARAAREHWARKKMKLLLESRA